MPAAATMDDFEALLNESFELETPEEGTVVKGTVLAIEAGQAIIDIGYKMEGRVDLKEFTPPGKAPEIKIGDVVEVYPQYDGPGQVTSLLAANIAYELLTLVAARKKDAG